MAYSDVAYPSRYGSWGALRHLDDSNPRWEALRVANLEPADWERRDEGAFDNGVIRSGSESGETLTGTPEEDDLLGHDGDDVLVSRGGADRLHGGDGRDLAVLPGPATGWVQVVDGNATLLSREGTTIRLTDVEVVRFEETVEEVELLSGD
jgi:hypothetical protein